MIINFSLRKKIMLIYMIAGLCPILLITNFFFATLIGNIKESAYHDFYREMEQTTNATVEHLTNLNLVINWMAYDNMLHQLLLDQYSDPYEYYAEFKSVHALMVQLRSMNTEVFKIEFLHNNPTAIYGGEFVYIGDTAEYIEEFNHYMEEEGIRKGISVYDKLLHQLYIYRKLDLYKGSKAYSVITKITVDLSSFLTDFKNEKDIKYYLFDGKDQMIVSNTAEEFDSKNVDNSNLMKMQTFENNGIFDNYVLYSTIPQNELLQTVKQIQVYQIFIMVICFVGSYYLIERLLLTITSQLTNFTKYMENVQEELHPYEAKIYNDEIGLMILKYNEMVKIILSMVIEKNQNELRERSLELENERAKSYVLYSQINPHFLSNTLNCIKMKCIINDEKETALILGDLSKMFRSLMLYNDPFAAVWQEIEFIETYLKIQKFRFGDKLDYSIIVDELAKQQRIPRMTLQPIIENSCIHGIQKKYEGGFLQIHAFVKGNILHILILDNGVGISEDKLDIIKQRMLLQDIEETSIGIVNVYNRLYFYFKDRLKFEITNNEDGGIETKIEIELETVE
jgi:two-component system sensor histidine kinase YesM